MEIGYNPDSAARSSEEFFADLQRVTLRHRQQRGTAPDTLGVTVPVSAPKTAEEFVNNATHWRSSLILKKGPMAYDNSDTPFESSYLQRRYDFIAASEDVRRYAYDDMNGRTVRAGQKPLGKVTVGMGFNMDRGDGREVFERVLGLDEKTFDAVRSGKRALSEVEIRKLADFTLNEAEQHVSSKLKDVNLNEHERLALVSMAFNSPALLGPKIISALQSGDKKTALQEILYNSNRKKNRGLATRRYTEGKMFLGAGESPDLPAFNKYLAEVFPDSKLASL